MLDAYTSRDAMDRLLWLSLNRNLTSIAAENQNHEQVVFAVVKAAEQKGWLDELVAAARADRPEHSELQRWAQDNLPRLSSDAGGKHTGVMSFDLEELSRIGADAVGENASLTFDSVEIDGRTATFAASRRGAPGKVLLRVRGEVLSREYERDVFSAEMDRVRRASLHPRVPDVLSSGLTQDGYPFIVLLVGQRVEPYSLPLPVEKVIDIGTKVVDALSVAHSCGATFGEIEPSHIVLAADGGPLLIFSQFSMLTTLEPPAVKPHEEVFRLCQTLLNMLGDHNLQKIREVAPGLQEAKLRDLLSLAMRGGLIAAALRDRLATLKRESAPHLDSSHVLARVPISTARSPFEADLLVVRGDLFDQDADIVIGFSDTFDTATGDSLVISNSSLQGQLVRRVYRGDVGALDRELNHALAAVPFETIETRDVKPSGKLQRYPIGTVAVLEHGEGRIFAVAFSRMDNNLVATSNVEFFQSSLSALWRTIRLHSIDRTVAMPIVGSGLSRMGVSRERLIGLILSSYKENVQAGLVCRHLRIVVHPSDAASIDLSGTILARWRAVE